MGTLHLNRNPLSKGGTAGGRVGPDRGGDSGKGGSIVAAIAYPTAEIMIDVSADQPVLHNFAYKDEVMHSEVHLPGSVPLRRVVELRDPEVLANAAAIHERRDIDRYIKRERVLAPSTSPRRAGEMVWTWVDSAASRAKVDRIDQYRVLAVRDNGELPNRLPAIAAIDVVRDIGWYGSSKGKLLVTAAHMLPHNPHYHTVELTRRWEDGDFGSLQPWVSSRGQPRTEDLEDTRREVAAIINSHLARQCIDHRVDHRSYESRGIELRPTVHEGYVSAVAGESERVRRNERITGHNRQLLMAKPDLIIPLLRDERARFDELAIRDQLARHLRDDDLVDRAVRQVLQSDQLVMAGADRGGQPLFCASDNWQAEQDLRKTISRLMLPGAARQMDAAAISAMTARADADAALSSKQRHDALVLAGGNAVGNVSHGGGNVGNGVTTVESNEINAATLRFVRESYDVGGVPVVGIAATSREAWELGREYRIDAHNIDSVVGGTGVGVGAGGAGSGIIAPGAVLMIDVRGLQLADVRKALAVMHAAEMAKARVHVIGDRHQADGHTILNLVNQAIGGPTVTVNQHQRPQQAEAWQREATGALSKLDVAGGLAAYRDHGGITWTETDRSILDQVATDFALSVGVRPAASRVVLADDMGDIGILNQRARDLLRARGVITGIDHEIKTYRGAIDVAAGDRVTFADSEYDRYNIRRGAFATVTVLKGKNTLGLRLDSGREIDLDTRIYTGIEHGWAVPAHRAREMVVDETYLVASRTMDAQTLKMAGSAHRQDIRIYGSKETFARGHDDMVQCLSRDASVTPCPVRLRPEQAVEREQARDRVRGYQMATKELERLQRGGISTTVHDGKKVGRKVAMDLARQQAKAQAIEICADYDQHRPHVKAMHIDRTKLESDAGYIRQIVPTENLMVTADRINEFVAAADGYKAAHRELVADPAKARLMPEIQRVEQLRRDRNRLADGVVALGHDAVPMVEDKMGAGGYARAVEFAAEHRRAVGEASTKIEAAAKSEAAVKVERLQRLQSIESGMIGGLRAMAARVSARAGTGKAVPGDIVSLDGYRDAMRARERRWDLSVEMAANPDTYAALLAEAGVSLQAVKDAAKAAASVAAVRAYLAAQAAGDEAEMAKLAKQMMEDIESRAAYRAAAKHVASLEVVVAGAGHSQDHGPDHGHGQDHESDHGQVAIAGANGDAWRHIAKTAEQARANSGKQVVAEQAIKPQVQPTNAVVKKRRMRI